MTERVAFSFEKKFRNRLLSRRPLNEHEILVGEVMTSNARWLEHMGFGRAPHRAGFHHP
jgi:hypothetical protein